MRGCLWAPLFFFQGRQKQIFTTLTDDLVGEGQLMLDKRIAPVDKHMGVAAADLPANPADIEAQDRLFLARAPLFGTSPEKTPPFASVQQLFFRQNTFRLISVALSCDARVSLPLVPLNCGHRHRLENPGKVPLLLLEVLSGEYMEREAVVYIDNIDCLLEGIAA